MNYALGGQRQVEIKDIQEGKEKEIFEIHSSCWLSVSLRALTRGPLFSLLSYHFLIILSLSEKEDKNDESEKKCQQKSQIVHEKKI